MPRKRQPTEIWYNTRLKVLERDDFKCQRCFVPVTEKIAHIDHIISGKRGSNHVNNLRTLCRRCHVLRVDSRHRGMTASALRDGIIDAGWRSEVWDG